MRCVSSIVNSLQKKSFTWLRARMKNHSMSINLLLVPFTGDHFFNFKKKKTIFFTDSSIRQLNKIKRTWQIQSVSKVQKINGCVPFARRKTFSNYPKCGVILMRLIHVSFYSWVPLHWALLKIWESGEYFGRNFD